MFGILAKTGNSLLQKTTSLNLFPTLLYLGMDIALLVYYSSLDSYSRSLQKLIKDRRDNIDLLKKTLKFAKLVEIVRYLQWIFMYVLYTIFVTLASHEILPLPEIGGKSHAIAWACIVILITTAILYLRALKNGEDCLSVTFNEVNEHLEGILSQNSKVVLRTSCFQKDGKTTRSYLYLLIYILVLATTFMYGFLIAYII